MIAFAQSGLPPASVPDGDSGDPAALVLRIEKLEDELRAANGAIEELQNQQHKLQEQLKRFQEDVEFRFNGANGTKFSAAPNAPAAPAAPLVAAVPPAPAAPAEPGAAKPRRSDAFDPNAEPGAVGAPRPLGTTTPSAPLDGPGQAVGAPLDLSHPGAGPAPGTPTGPLDGDQPTVIAGISAPAVDGPREQYNAALDAYRAGQYDQAESQLRTLLAHNASARFAPDATFFLGESYLQRSRPREAAEQYLKVSTDYARSPRAPEAMLRLGQSLAMLGNNEQACATFSEVSRRFPTASSSIKKSVEREMQKDHC